MVINGISEKVLERLNQIGWNRAVFAQKLGVSEKSLQRLLESEDVKKLDTFVLICKYLGLSPLTLLASNVLRHPFLDYFNIYSPSVGEGHLVDLVFDYGKDTQKKHLVFTKGLKGEYFTEQKEEDFEDLKAIYPKYLEGFNTQNRGLKVVQLTEDTPELKLLKQDFVLCINKPSLNYAFLEYMRYGIGYAVAEVNDGKGGLAYGIIKPIDGSTLSLKQAMETDDFTLVFVDDPTYHYWQNEKLPQTKYSKKMFNSKVLSSDNFMGEPSFKLYPIIGFIKNLTYRILQSYLNKKKG